MAILGKGRHCLFMRDLTYNSLDVAKYSLWRGSWPQVQFLPALFAFLGNAIATAGSAVVSTGSAVISTAGTIGSSAISTAGTVASGAAHTAGTVAIGATKAVGSMGAYLASTEFLTSAKPIAEVLGKAYGVYATLEQQKQQKEQLKLYQKIQAAQTGGTAMANPNWSTISDQILGSSGVPPVEPGFEGEGYPPTAEFDINRYTSIAVWALIGYVIYKAVSKK